MSKMTKRVVALMITLLMLVSAVPMSVFAAISNWQDNNVIFNGTSFGTNGYYNVISKKDYVLVPGAAVESEMVLNNATGTRRQVLHIIEVDPSNPDVSIVPGYYQIDKDLTNEANWSHKELTEMAKYYEENLGYNIVGGMNTDLYYSSYSPRVLVYNGESIGNFGKNVATGGDVLKPTSSILYVFKDAEGNISCNVKAFNLNEFNKYLEDGTLLHAVGVSFGMVVNDGKLVNAKESRGSDDAARSMVGVKEDGTLVICMNDGRGANNSVGFSSYEEGEAMLALGCKWAANCDGGGSSTFLSKRAGEDAFTMRSVPCDGAQRATAHGIFVASNVAPTGILNNINVLSDYDIFAPNTAYTFGAEAIDTHGYAMDIPEDVQWSLSDSSFGTIVDGKFVSNGTKGNVDIQIISGGTIVGSKTITVADPEVFELSATSTTVPYSTEDKIRTITLPIIAKTGEANVYYDTNAVSVTLSDENAGVLDGFNFTTPFDTSVKGVDVAIKYGSTTLVYSITFGKGSEVIYDFEDGTTNDFMGFEAAKKWSIDNDINNTLIGAEPLAGQFNEYLSSDTLVASAENGGQVRNGKYSLAWKLDNTNASFANWSYNVLFNTGDTIVLRDVENGKLATTLGMWIYIPEEAFCTADGKAPAFQSQFYIKNTDGTYSCKQDHFMFESALTGKKTNLNSATNADIPESRWVYATIDISKYDYLSTPIATDTSNSRSPSFIRTYVKPSVATNITFYVDDITLDYSSAVDDRVLPTITSPTYSISDTAITLDNGATINGNKIAFSATVSDNSAIDLTSGKISVDGVKLESEVVGNTLSSKEDASLVAGKHTVSFEVKDELGNTNKITRTFTVSGDAVVELGGHNDSGVAAKAQSIYYVDINVEDLADVNKLTATLKLNSANTWETDGVIVADGFKAELVYNDLSELLTVTVEKISDKNAKAVDNTLVSVPVRVWEYDRYDFVKEEYIPVASMGNRPVVNINCAVVEGEITFANKTTSPFGGSINVATELTTISSPYHIHDAELTVLNKEATEAEFGYENRTYCESCKSVVDWGTKLDKIVVTHNYDAVDGKFVCTDEGCDEVYEIEGTTLVEMNDKLYYAIAGKLVTGWQLVDDSYYYFDPTTYAAVDGVAKLADGYTYKFKDYKLFEGELVKNSAGTRYRYAGKFVQNQWAKVGGKDYFLQWNTYAITGTTYLKLTNTNPYWYVFAADGALVKKITHTGLFKYAGKTYYLIDGASQRGLVLAEDGYYYYFSSSTFEAVKNQTYVISNTNGLDIKVGSYQFMADGRMKEGLILEENGDVAFYKDGKPVYAGLVKDSEGNLYYINSTKKAVKNCSYNVSEAMSNGLLPAGTYEFMADGKMKSGLVVESNGDVKFYKDGKPAYTGLIKDEDGNMYYINSTKKAVRGCKYYVGETMANGLMPAGTYEFAADGRLKNGLTFEENGDITFYKNGKTIYAGLVQDKNGNMYYINSSKKAVKGCTYQIGEVMANGLMPAGTYEFMADGRLKNGLVFEDNGDITFYKGGKAIYAGLVQDAEGNLYYINSTKKAVKNCSYTISAAMSNGLMPAGTYEFTADGKMKNGLTFEENGDIVFYENGKPIYAGVVQDKDGNFYYINSSKKAVKNCTYTIYATMTNDLVPAGTYTIDAEGKLVF